MLLCLRVEMLSDDDAVRTGGEFWISYVRLAISGGVSFTIEIETIEI